MATVLAKAHTTIMATKTPGGIPVSSSIYLGKAGAQGGGDLAHQKADPKSRAC
jgi:hypothetical protein